MRLSVFSDLKVDKTISGRILDLSDTIIRGRSGRVVLKTGNFKLRITNRKAASMALLAPRSATTFPIRFNDKTACDCKLITTNA